jgi:hypothetical protein
LFHERFENAFSGHSRENGNSGNLEETKRSEMAGYLYMIRPVWMPAFAGMAIGDKVPGAWMEIIMVYGFRVRDERFFRDEAFL